MIHLNVKPMVNLHDTDYGFLLKQPYKGSAPKYRRWGRGRGNTSFLQSYGGNRNVSFVAPGVSNLQVET